MKPIKHPRVDGVPPGDTRESYLARIESLRKAQVGKPEECADMNCHQRGPGYCVCGVRHYGMTYAEISGESPEKATDWLPVPMVNSA